MLGESINESIVAGTSSWVWNFLKVDFTASPGVQYEKKTIARSFRMKDPICIITFITEDVTKKNIILLRKKLSLKAWGQWHNETFIHTFRLFTLLA